jgi:hypothetical protein
MTGRLVQESFVALGANPAERTLLCMLLDPLLLVLLFLAIRWAFGSDVALLAIVFWGANPIVMFDYTGGAFLRQDWMVATVLSFCLFKKEKHLLAGMSLAYAIMTRVFPAAFLIYPAFRFLRRFFKEKKIDRGLFRFGLGAALAGAVLFFGSLAFTHGIDSWKVFIHNGQRHDKGVYTNHISFRNLFLFEPSGFAASYRKDHGELYHEVWRREKMARMESLAPFYYGAILLTLGATLWLFRDEDLLAGMGVAGFLPFLFFYPANYYFLFLFPLLFYLAGKPAQLPWLYAFSVGASIANLMSRGGDRNSTMVSLLLFAGLLAVLIKRHGDLKPGTDKT